MMVSPNDVWVETRPQPENLGFALLPEEHEVVLALDWNGGDDLRTIWTIGNGGQPQPLLWPMRTRPVEQGNLMWEGQLMAYSSREH